MLQVYKDVQNRTQKKYTTWKKEQLRNADLDKSVLKK